MPVVERIAGKVVMAPWLLVLMLGTLVCGQTPNEDLVVIGGTVLTQATDAPIAGITVMARSYSRTHGIKELGAPVETDDQGRWVVSVPRPKRQERSIAIRFLSRTYGSVTVDGISKVNGDVLELAPVHLDRGVLLKGRVVNVDAKGTPILKAQLVPAGILTAGVDTDAVSPVPMRLRPNGEFELQWALVPGKWTFQSESHTPLERRIRLKANQAEATIEIRVSAGRLLKLGGTVVDSKGDPLAGVEVTASRDGARFETGAYLRTKSDESGIFELSRRFAPEESLQGWRLGAHLRFYKQVTPPNRIDQPMTWSDESMRVVMTGEPLVRLRVQRADTGDLLSKFRVYGTFWHEGSKQPKLQPLFGAHTDIGLVRVENRPGWSHRILLVRAEDQQLAPSAIHLVRTDEQRDEITFTLRPAQPRTVVVRDPEGQPITGAQVTASLRGDSGLGKVFTKSGGTIRLEPGAHMLLTQGETDSLGRFRFFASNNAEVSLEVSHLGHLSSKLTHRLVDAGSPSQTITLENGAVLTGKVSSKAWLDRYFSVNQLLAHRGSHFYSREGLRLIRSEHFDALRGYAPKTPSRSGQRPNHLLPPPPPKVSIEPNGTFKIEGIPDGSWMLVWDQTPNPDAKWSLQSEIPIAGPIHLRSDATEHVEVDMSAHIPKRVSASLTLNGKAHHLFSAKWHGWGHTPIGSDYIAPRLETARSDMWAVGEMLPGTYYLQIEWGVPLMPYATGSIAGLTYTTLPAHITVVQDGRSHFKLEAQIKRSLSLTLTRQSNGKPLSGAALFRRFSDNDPGDWLETRWPRTGRWGSRSRASGKFPLHTLAAGTHRIYIPTRKSQESWPKNGPTWSHLSGPNDPRAEQLVFIGTIEVREDNQSFNLQVPPQSGW